MPPMKLRLLAAGAAALALQAVPTSAPTQEPRAMPSHDIPPDDPVLNKASLDQLKRHIIAKGTRCTYVNKYNNNPCWSVPPYMLYLNPDPGPGPDGHPQWNINCDVTLGDFNTLVVRHGDGSGPTGLLDFRQADALDFRAYGRGLEASTDEAAQALAMFRSAVRAALLSTAGR